MRGSRDRDTNRDLCQRHQPRSLRHTWNRLLTFSPTILAGIAPDSSLWPVLHRSCLNLRRRIGERLPLKAGGKEESNYRRIRRFLSGYQVDFAGLGRLALAWTFIVGEQRARCHGPPRGKSHGRRQRSLFRYGLDWLRGILTTPEPQDPAFFDCLRGLRSPTAFLSCAHT